MKQSLILVGAGVLVVTAATFWLLGGIDPAQLQTTLGRMGWWAPLIYMIIYTIATTLLLPSTALNLAGGALFGPWWGTLWTSIGAVVAAMLTFWFTRKVGRNWVEQRLGQRWQAVDAEIQQGGLFYLFSIRLLPIIPYGIVNAVAGLTSVSFRDYTLGTMLGTVPGIFPFVMLGSSGLAALQTGQVLPLILPLTMIGLLVGGATWYRQQRQDPRNRD